MATRRGFTLVEVLMALLILSLVLLALGTSTGGFLRTVSDADRSNAAIALAEDRIARIQLDPNYAALETNYQATETTLPGLPNYTRTTSIVRVGGANQTTDHKNVTVTVNGPGLTAPVSRSITVAAP